MSLYSFKLMGNTMFVFNFQDVTALVIGGAMLLVLAWIYITNWWKARNCPHHLVRETMACDAVCKNCNKNLGFIGTWREKNKL